MSNEKPTERFKRNWEDTVKLFYIVHPEALGMNEEQSEKLIDEFFDDIIELGVQEMTGRVLFMLDYEKKQREKEGRA